MALLTSCLFPFSNVLSLLVLPPETWKATSSRSVDRSAVADVLARYLRYVSYWLLSFLSYKVLPHPGPDAATYSWKWISVVVARNLLITHITYGGFHYFLYECKWTRDAIRSKKFWDANLRQDGSLDTKKGYDPSRDRRLTSFGVVLGSLMECFVLHMWATAKWNSYDDFWKHWVWSLTLVALLPYWADFHFFFIHRFIHPWCPQRLGRYDLGKFLYKHVHSIHHKSYNTGPWTGLAMHPFEQLLFFSSILVPIAQHPMHLYLGFFHKLIAPLGGHDGFSEPGGDGYFHFLHHKHFEINYGSPTVPLDKLFGTYSDGSSKRS